MTTDDSTARLLKACAATGVMLAVGWLVAPTLSSWHSGRLADRLVERIADAKDTQVKVPLRQLADLGETAIEPLVVAAASDRASVAAIARQIIDEKLATWEMLAEAPQRGTLGTDSASNVAKLATSLASQIENFGPAGQQWTERLALAMIDLTDRLPVQQSQVVLAQCSRVLAFVPPRGPRLRTLTPRSKIAADFDSEFDANKFTAPAPKLESLTRSSEGALEILARIQPGVPTEAFRSQQHFAMPKITTPKIVQGSPVSESTSTELSWLPQQNGTVNLQPPPFASAPSENRLTFVPKPAGSVRGVVVDVPGPQDMADRADTLRQLTSEELLLRLGMSNFYEAGIVRVVLGERGYADAELALRQRFTSSLAAERKRLVEEVSRLPAVASRRMLRWLLGDESGDVRLQALTALATTRSPDLTQLARDLALRDDDPRVAKLASRLLQQSRK